MLQNEKSLTNSFHLVLSCINILNTAIFEPSYICRLKYSVGEMLLRAEEMGQKMFIGALHAFIKRKIIP